MDRPAGLSLHPDPASKHRSIACGVNACASRRSPTPRCSCAASASPIVTSSTLAWIDGTTRDDPSAIHEGAEPAIEGFGDRRHLWRGGELQRDPKQGPDGRDALDATKRLQLRRRRVADGQLELRQLGWTY